MKTATKKRARLELTRPDVLLLVDFSFFYFFFVYQLSHLKLCLENKQIEFDKSSDLLLHSSFSIRFCIIRDSINMLLLETCIEWYKTKSKRDFIIHINICGFLFTLHVHNYLTPIKWDVTWQQIETVFATHATIKCSKIVVIINYAKRNCKKCRFEYPFFHTLEFWI